MACKLQLYFKLHLGYASGSASLQLSTQICEVCVCVCALLQTCDPTCVATPVSGRKLLGDSSPWTTLGVALYDRWQAGSNSRGPRRRKLADRPCCTTTTTQVSSPHQCTITLILPTLPHTPAPRLPSLSVSSADSSVAYF